MVTSGVWAGRRVLVTGHTGFKGSWLCLMLVRLGARVTGIALDPEPGPTAFDILGIPALLDADHRADIRDAARLATLVRDAAPEVVLHLAAQAFVGRSYVDPAGTFASNVDGTINLLEAMRGLPGIAAAVIVTSDKVYRNDGTGRAFLESDPLGGADPYSASKAACEIAVASWRASFATALPPLATARAGNVIGGGDFGAQRLVPDLVRAQLAGEALLVRRPDATRPFQHVAEVLRGYLMLAERLATDPAGAPAALNFGPRDGTVKVRDLLALWGDVDWIAAEGPQMQEAPLLGLDSTRAGQVLGWHPRLDTPAAIAETAAWYATWRSGGDAAGHARALLERLA